MNQKESDSIIEALLFANSSPIKQSELNHIFDSDIPNLKNTVLRLNKFYSRNNRSYKINQVAGGYQLLTKKHFEPWIRKLIGKSNKLTLSSAALDTLAIIAYKQPICRFDIDSIRGVDSSGVLKTLLSRNLIKIKGRDKSPGRPLLYTTTKLFLEYFGINNLSDMPKLKEVKELIDSDSSLGDQINVFQDTGNLKEDEIK